jgi:hypothetical protein
MLMLAPLLRWPLFIAKYVYMCMKDTPLNFYIFEDHYSILDFCARALMAMK